MVIREMPTKTLYWVTVMPFAYILYGCFQQVTLAELRSCNRDLRDMVVSLGLKNLNCLLSVLDRSLPTLLRHPPTSSPASSPASLHSSHRDLFALPTVCQPQGFPPALPSVRSSLPLQFSLPSGLAHISTSHWAVVSAVTGPPSSPGPRVLCFPAQTDMEQASSYALPACPLLRACELPGTGPRSLWALMCIDRFVLLNSCLLNDLM